MMNLLIGLLAGVFGGLFGVGGGLVMVPLMVGLLKLTQIKAHGTSLAAMVFVGVSGAATYALQGSVDFFASLVLAFTAMMTAYWGARYATSLPEKRLRRSFGIFLLIVSALLFLKPVLSGLACPAGGGARVLVLLATGALTGFLSGMMGVGGAVIMIPAMVLLVGMEQHTAQGSSLMTMIPMGLAGSLTHVYYGNVETRLLWGLVPGVFIGTYCGGTAAHFLSEGISRSVFGIVVIWTAVCFLKDAKN